MYPLMLIDKYEQVDRSVKRNWEYYASYGKLTTDLREVVGSSWQRCQSSNLSKNLKQAPKQLSDYLLKITREQHEILLAVAHPIIKMLCEQFDTQGLVMVLTDNQGTILLEEATHETVRDFDRLNFSKGAVWSEEYCGTNAIGTALKTTAPVTIFSAEHYCEGWHHLVCTATIINDPYTNSPLGVLDLTGKKELLGAHNFSIVHAAKLLIEQELEQDFIRRIPSPYPHLYEDKKPVIVFNMDGKITRYNRIARLLFDIKERANFCHKFKLPSGSQINRNVKVNTTYTTEDGKSWNLIISPHLLDQQLLGGIAIFEPITITKSQKNLNPPEPSDRDYLIAHSNQLVSLIEEAKRAAKFDFPVLLTGPTGVGKEKFAQYIHRYSLQQTRNFIPVNCGAIPKELIGSELFGYVSGAFTGADTKGKKGKFELAHKGVLFLDEIAELPLDIQPYLLRVLEEKKVYPLGGDRAIPVDVRIIAATHKNLEQEVEEGRFRSDLYYRLNVIHIAIPDLKNRQEDILPLFQYFLTRHTSFPLTLHPQTQQKLLQYPWPGNVRELKNAAEHTIFMLKDALEVLPEHLPEQLKQFQPSSTLDRHHTQIQLINAILKQTDGNISKAAKMLNISRMTVYRKLKRV